MKLFLLVFLSLSYLVFGQQENPNYAGKVLAFQQAYNTSNYVGIFNMFDVNMKQALPLNKTREFFTNNVKQQMGNIQEMQFVELRNGGHVYRTNFDKAVTDILISLDASLSINGLYIFPPKPLDAPIVERNTTPMKLPFDDKWYVFWGGVTEEDNYHVAYENQKYAYDFLILNDGVSFNESPKENENYFAFGKEIKAPCNARVVKVIDGVEDNVPGVLNSKDVTGNTVILKTDNDEFLLFAHLKNGSILVETGQDIYEGDVIGLCGNSGNSTEPHLHLSLQNTEDFPLTTGGKLFFDAILVNGEIERDYLPKKGEYISNSN